ncbi:MAG: D-sedoheptulose 7-phosphate isomerase [Crocinitomicaceae bacterium TMED114]|nr:MAG: D-sedoheptulose 7-phosphate isomerase [Crocinitomicaceae bacterium TMED114]
MEHTQRLREHFDQAQEVLNAFMSDPQGLNAVAEAAEAMASSILSGGKVISCGNGGSMCDAMHFAEELSGRYREDRKALPALSISDPSHLSCVGNDHGYEFVFSRFVEAMGRSGDVLLAISTSGNSPNVVRAAEAARRAGMTVVGLTGKDGGALAELCDVEVRVPWSGYADRIQEVHIKCIHAFIDHIEAHCA